jgi:hypothetical protein
VVVEEIPAIVQRSMQAREEYISHVPPERDAQHFGLDYTLYIAEMYFLYGHFQEAQARGQPLYDRQCGKSEHGYEAWKILLRTALLQNDAARALVLSEAAQKKSCAMRPIEVDEEKRLSVLVAGAPNPRSR